MYQVWRGGDWKSSSPTALPLLQLLWLGAMAPDNMATTPSTLAEAIIPPEPMEIHLIPPPKKVEAPVVEKTANGTRRFQAEWL